MNHPHSKEIDFILKSLRAAAGGRQITINEFKTDDLDWDWLLKTAGRHHVIAFISNYWEKQNAFFKFPASAKKNLQLFLLHGQNAAAQKLKEFKEVALLLNQSKIPVIPLKGVALLLTVYKEFPCRFMSDIDILIRKNDLIPAEYSFRKASYWPHSPSWCGFSSRYQWRDRILPRDIYGSSHFNKEKIEVDVHWDPHYFIGDTRNSLGSSDFWDRAVASPEIAPNVWLLSANDLFDVVFFHAMDFHAPSLSQFFDLAMLIKHYQIKFDHIAKKNLPDTPSGKRPAYSAFWEMLEEVFFSDKESFSNSTEKILTDTVDTLEEILKKPTAVRSREKSSIAYFLHLKNMRERLLFLAGYFCPNPEYYAPDKGFKMHLRHWKEVSANIGAAITGRRN